jgi:hypothetical protein
MSAKPGLLFPRQQRRPSRAVTCSAMSLTCFRHGQRHHRRAGRARGKQSRRRCDATAGRPPRLIDLYHRPMPWRDSNAPRLAFHATNLAQGESGAVEADGLELWAPRARGSGSRRTIAPLICSSAPRSSVNIKAKIRLRRELSRPHQLLIPPNRFLVVFVASFC